MRRATIAEDVTCVLGDISIHALHEESDLGTLAELSGLGISIHALHEESDTASTDHRRIIQISIHALHEESDLRAVMVAAS